MNEPDPATSPATNVSTYEPAPGLAPVAPVLPPKAPRSAGRARWAIGFAIIALVIGASAVVGALIGASPVATVLGYVPDKTIVYTEVRLDLPGDQRRSVGTFLSKFPGFADQAALDTKLDEVLDRLIKDATTNDQTYTTDIKPWFDGELAFSVGPLPDPTSLMANPRNSLGSARFLALLSIKDQAGAQAWFDKAFTKASAKTTTQTYNGATLTVSGEGDGPRAAFAVLDGKVVVAGDLTSVKAAVDTKGSGGFAAEADPKAALAAAKGDHIGFAFLAIKPLAVWSQQVAKSVPGATGGPISDSMVSLLPDWGAYWLRIEGDAVVLRATAPKPATVLGPTEDRTSPVVDHVPAGAVVAAVSLDTGKTLRQIVDAYKADPALKSTIDSLDQAAGLVGGTDAAIGWIGDTAIVINVADDTPEGGLVIVPTDKDAAARLFTSLRTLIGLGGGQVGATIRDEPYAGTTITIVDLGDAAALAGMAGLGSGAATIPLPAGHVELAFAITDKVVVLGSGPGFVKHVLDTSSTTSLASNARYKALVDRAGSGAGGSFVDIAAIRGLVEGAIASAGPAAVAAYEKDIKPYLAPFDAMYASGSVGGDLTSSTILITVK